ncbi:BspA family leucine-rich repeat surface protein [Dokdonia sp.]|uniref:BspA family leucine-rich repeat surface protein n=1 Tax=Dokdonia sp. TaxID=2024995 RepID=UPI003263A7A3
MRANTPLLAIFFIALGNIFLSHAQCSDISQNVGGLPFGLNPTIYALGNTFTPTCTDNLRGVTFYFKPQPPIADETPVTVELHQDPFGNNGGPTLLESITQVIPLLQEDYSVFFDLTSSVTAGVEYSIRIVRGDQNVIVSHSRSNPYSNGRFFKNDFDTYGFGVPPDYASTDDWDLRFQIHYSDDTPPIALCKNITRFLDANNTVTIEAIAIDNGSSDTNSTITYSISQDTFDCSDVGENMIILTIEDEAGNTATCEAIVTIIDTVDPVLTCPSNIIVYPDVGAPAIVNYDQPLAIEECAIAAPDGFDFLGPYDGKNYFVSQTPLVPSEAFTNAESLGGYLATIVDTDHNTMLLTALVNNGITQETVMIGFNDVDIEGTFKWHSGSSSNYSNWISGEPNNSGAGEDYTQFRTDGTWNDINNATPRNYILELSPEVIQTAGFASGTEFPDGETINTFQTTDASGNEGECSFTVTVKRNVTPEVVCQNPTKQFTDLSEITIAPNELDGGSTANVLLIESNEFIVEVTADSPEDQMLNVPGVPNNGIWNYQEFAFMVPNTGSYTFTMSGDSGSNFNLWDSPIIPNSGIFHQRPNYISGATFYANGNLLAGNRTHTLNAGQVYYISLIGLDPGDLFSGTLQINNAIYGSLSKYITDPCSLGGSIAETLYAVSYTGDVESCVSTITLDDVNNLCSPFITEWETTTSNEIITFPITTNTGTLSIDWGDGTIENGLNNNPAHSYANPGTYTVQAYGDISTVHFNDTGSKLNIIDITQWGTIKWSTMENAFKGCENLDVSATDAPNLTQVTNLSYMFFGCESLEGNSSFNDWNVSSVENMTYMFSGAELFNQPIGNWNVEQVTEMTNMFFSALAFNQPIGNWNVGQVTDMYAMFNTAESFNQNLNNWNTSNVQIMSLTFYGATAFNGNIGNWNVEQVTEMKSMFVRAESFNQNISSWNTGNATEMDHMFLEAINFDQNIGSWNTSQVFNMEGMFQQATSFNQDIGNWNTSQVTDMGWMFKDATLFNQNLEAWDVSAVNRATEMLEGTSLSSTNYDNLLIGWSQLNLQNMVSFGVDATYCFGREGKTIMENTFNWSIDDEEEDCGDVFITKWETSTANETITIPINAAAYTYDYIVDWGDGTVELGVTTDAVHNYVTPGEHTVKIKGLFPIIYFNNSGDRLKLNEIVQWGNNPWASMEFAFYGCENLIIAATDAPNLSNVTNMEAMLRKSGNEDNINLWADISHWDVSTIQDMSSLFRNTYFNQNISTWNVSNVIDMKRMFQENSQFNQDISSWNVSNVENMFAMLYFAINFNQDIAVWNVSKVENMRWMLRNTAFNHNLGSWDISSVTHMGDMLKNSLLSTENYDHTLIGWATDSSGMVGDGNDDVPTNIELGTNSSYCLAEIQRTLLITPIINGGYNWVIDDNDIAPTCNVDNSILSFTLPEEIETAEIDENNSTVNIRVLLSANLTALTPTIIISEGATISPNTNTTQDFTNPFIYIVTSENGRVRQWTVTVTRMPEITTATTVDVLENQTAVIDVDTTDPEGETEGNGLTYSLTTINGGVDNGGFNIDINTGVITFISAPDFENPNDDDIQNDYELQVTVTNSNGLSTIQNITVTVININETSAIDDTATTDEENTITINLVVNDIDDDGDDLTIQSIDDTGLLGQITIEADNKNVTYNPNGNFEYLGVGQTATETFTYTVTDGNGEEGTATVTITITGVNDPVQAVDDQETTDANAIVTIQALVNDIDLDDDDLTIQSVDTIGNIGGVVTVSPEGDTIAFDPNGDFDQLPLGESVAITFNYTVTDGITTDIATVTITIIGVSTESPFISTWTVGSGESITIPTNANYIYKYTIIWGDGETEIARTGDAAHTYVTAGTYSVQIIGDFPKIDFDNSSQANRNKIQEVTQWGDVEWIAMENAFYGCGNLDITANDTPDLSGVTSAKSMFQSATSLTGLNTDFNSWDVSNITNMSYMFSESSFNQDISNWNVSNVTDMTFMFAQSSFNKDIGNWNVSSVTGMGGMFRNNSEFNQDISNWNVSNVIGLSGMFQNTTSFNHNLGNWDISSVTNMTFMLENTNLSTQNYDNTLIGWATLDAGETLIPTGIELDASSSYCLAEIQRTLLITPIVNGGYNWVINDNNLDPNCNIDNSILSFELAEEIEPASINESSSTVTTTVPFAVDVTTLTPDITVSTNATISPDTGISQDFTNPVIYTVTSENGRERQWTITVIRAPGITSATTVNAEENQTLAIDVDTTDPEGDTEGNGLTYSFTSLNGGTDNGLFDLDTHTGIITFLSAPNFEFPEDSDTQNDYDIQVTVTNSNGLTDVKNITVIVTNVNEIDAVDDTPTTDEENTVTTNLITNDIDFEGNGITIQSINDTGLLGQVTIEADNKNVTYNPNGNFEYLGVGQTATETFTYTITDGNGAEATATVTITITGVNDPVQAVNDNVATIANETITMLLQANDIDIDGDNLSITSADDTGDIGGIVTVSPTGDFVTFDPNGDFDDLLFGESTDVTFSYTVTDGLTTDTGTVTITIVSTESTFTTTWAVEAGGAITIPVTSNYVYDYAVIWGDGTSQTGITGDATHSYATSGTYTVKILGTFPAIHLGVSGGRDNAEKLLTIEQWGAIQWLSMDSAFEDAENLNITNPDIDTPNLSNVTSMNDMFYDCDSFNGDITNWDVSNVQSFNEMFGYCYNFNQPIGVWNMSSATDFYYMFYEASIFNQPLDNWDVSNVTNMEGMFSYALAFDQNLNTWNVSNVTSMEELFYGAEVFNGDISSWDVSNVENMEDMFEDAYLFNQNISTWNVSKVENMEDMFYVAEAFNQDISNWDVSNVTNMSDMFRAAYAFDQNLGNWDLSSIVDTESSSSGLKRMFGLGPTGGSLSVSNYDSTLIGWSTDSSGIPNDGIDDIPTGINFGGGKNEYCSSELERQNLIDTYGWSISDQGLYANCNLEVLVSPKVYLQGASLNSNTGEETLMRDDLRVANLVPTTSPYDGLTCDVTVFDTTGPNAVVDWIFVELRDPINNDIVIEGKSALLLRNGAIVDIDGISPLLFFQSFGDYHIAITHRNHLGVMTATTVSLSNIAITLDFSSDSNIATGGSLALTDMGNGIFAIYAGDVDADGNILNTDISNAISNSGGINIYAGADVNMDGNILNDDIALFIQRNAGRIQQF